MRVARRSRVIQLAISTGLTRYTPHPLFLAIASATEAQSKDETHEEGTDTNGHSDENPLVLLDIIDESGSTVSALLVSWVWGPRGCYVVQQSLPTGCVISVQSDGNEVGVGLGQIIRERQKLHIRVCHFAGFAFYEIACKVFVNRLL